VIKKRLLKKTNKNWL